MHSTPVNRRLFLGQVLAAGAAVAWPRCARAAESAGRVPLIDCTDLYHPHQDVGDNLDLIAPYALPEIDLRAVIIDVTERFRTEGGARDAGFIPVQQLNAIFDRSVPCAVAPYRLMRSPDDAMRDAPAYQQAGIELLLDTLEQSPEGAEIAVFGSARAVAAACNRRPDLVRAKTRRLHLCIGAAEPGFIEWNVALDPHAFVRLLRSDLPIALYPCATREGPFAYGRHNCFWKLPDLRFIARMEPRLQAYLAYAFLCSNRVDFLRAVEEPPTLEQLAQFTGKTHNVWEISVWLEVTGRKLVRRADGSHRIVPRADVLPTDTVLPSELRPCRIEARDTGEFTFELVEGPSNFAIYDRGDPHANEIALCEALPALYESFRPQ